MMSSFTHNTYSYTSDKNDNYRYVVEYIKGTELNYLCQVCTFIGLIVKNENNKYDVVIQTYKHAWSNTLPPHVTAVISETELSPENNKAYIATVQPHIMHIKGFNIPVYKSINSYNTQEKAYKILKGLYNQFLLDNEQEIDNNRKKVSNSLDLATFDYIEKIEKERDTWKSIAESLLKNIKQIQTDLQKDVDSLDNLYKLFTNPFPNN